MLRNNGELEKVNGFLAGGKRLTFSKLKAVAPITHGKIKKEVETHENVIRDLAGKNKGIKAMSTLGTSILLQSAVSQIPRTARQ
ncbi:TPA: hypothetical protein HA244_02990 [Candidatus Micrarchaeota archaeon]|nr:hypothetical protein [Candidatus Micrarchaeota archaeon]